MAVNRLVNQFRPDTRTDEQCNAELARRWGPYREGHVHGGPGNNEIGRPLPYVLHELTGSFDRAALRRLTWPVAWSPTASAEARAEYERAISALVTDALAALDETPDAVAVNIVAGAVDSVEVA